MHAHIFRDQMISAVRTVLDPQERMSYSCSSPRTPGVGQFQDPMETALPPPVKFTVSLQRVADILSGIDVHGAVLGADGFSTCQAPPDQAGPRTGQRFFFL